MIICVYKVYSLAADSLGLSPYRNNTLGLPAVSGNSVALTEVMGLPVACVTSQQNCASFALLFFLSQVVCLPSLFSSSFQGVYICRFQN